MKRYRLTRTTVKTKETFSVSGNVADLNCPLCDQPLPALRFADESSAGPPKNQSRAAEFPLIVDAVPDKETN